MAFEIALVIIERTWLWWTSGYILLSGIHYLICIWLISWPYQVLGQDRIETAIGILTKLPTEDVRKGLNGFKTNTSNGSLYKFCSSNSTIFHDGNIIYNCMSFVTLHCKKLFEPGKLPTYYNWFLCFHSMHAYPCSISGFENIPAGVSWSKP